MGWGGREAQWCSLWAVRRGSWTWKTATITGQKVSLIPRGTMFNGVCILGLIWFIKPLITGVSKKGASLWVNPTENISTSAPEGRNKWRFGTLLLNGCPSLALHSAYSYTFTLSHNYSTVSFFSIQMVIASRNFSKKNVLYHCQGTENLI